MSIYALVIGIVLMGQVVAGDDRYSVPSGSHSSGNPYSATDAGNGAPSGSRLAPLGQLPAANPYSSPPADSTFDGPLQPVGSSRRDMAPSSLGAAPSTDSAVSPYGTSPQSGAAANDSADARPGTIVAPSALMRAMLTAPRESRLTGAPVTLTDAAVGASSRAEQTQRVEAYWDLSSSVADYYLGLHEQAELRRLRSLVGRVGPAWQQAESELAVRIGTSQRAAAASQHRLASLMGRGTPLPLPGDMPHCGDYRTRYEEIFSGRPSAEAAQLSELLPLRYEELRDAATAVARAEEWLDMVAAKRSDNSDGTGMLRALELLALRRRAFVQIARDYNRRIARYAELAAPGQVDAEVLVGMLIKTDRQTSTATRPSTPPPRDRQSQSTGGAPRARADDWAPATQNRPDNVTRDPAIHPASGEATSPPREHSLLVSPR